MTPCAPLQFVIPVFNDWASVQQLLPLIDAQLSRSADVLLVDDGSTERAPRTWDMPLQWIRRIRILRLVRNLGHQRAICVGLCHARSMVECERVVVMDGDGEVSATLVPGARCSRIRRARCAATAGWVACSRPSGVNHIAALCAPIFARARCRCLAVVIAAATN